MYNFKILLLINCTKTFQFIHNFFNINNNIYIIWKKYEKTEFTEYSYSVTKDGRNIYEICNKVLRKPNQLQLQSTFITSRNYLNVKVTPSLFETSFH